MGGASNNVAEQIGKGYFQCPGNLQEGAESQVGCAVLDCKEMGAMNTASLGKGRLRRPVFSLEKVTDSVSLAPFASAAFVVLAGSKPWCCVSVPIRRHLRVNSETFMRNALAIRSSVPVDKSCWPRSMS